jgi:predicted CoA-binding protein
MTTKKEELIEIYTTIHTIAVVGATDNPGKPSHDIPAYLQKEGYKIIPVNPTINKALGEKVYPSLRDIPEPIDVVDIFRRAEFVSAIVDDAIAIGAKIIWMQTGIVSQEAAEKARAAGLQVVMDMCMGAVHHQMKERGEI